MNLRNFLQHVAQVYDADALPPYKIRPQKNPQDYIQIQPWTMFERRTHYEFRIDGEFIRAELHVESEKAAGLRGILACYNGKSLCEGLAALRLDQSWYKKNNGCRLFVEFTPPTFDPGLISQSMNELMAMTSEAVEAHLEEQKQLSL